MEFLNGNENGNENGNNNENINENGNENGNLNNFVRCSFCGILGHDIRFCDSPEIPNIETTIVNLFVENYQECLMARMNEDLTHSMFITKIVSRFLLRHIRVLAVALRVAPASGFNKAEYASSIYIFLKNVNNLLLFRNRINLNIPYILGTANNENVPPNHVVRNLLPSFNLVANTNTNKKFNITPVLDFSHTPEELENECECGICLESNIKLQNMTKLNCEHSFCGDCITRVLQSTPTTKHPNCALCRAHITTIEINSQDKYDAILEYCRA